MESPRNLKLTFSQALEDFFEAPQTIVGQSDSMSGDLVAEMYQGIAAPIMQTDLSTAETLKYVNNAFHALKISFANEIGAICSRFSIDGHRVMDLLCPLGPVAIRDLDVRDVHRAAAAATLGEQFGERAFDRVVILATHVAHHQAARLGDRLGQRDQLFEIGERAGLVLQSGGQPEAALFHRLADELLHGLELLR